MSGFCLQGNGNDRTSGNGVTDQKGFKGSKRKKRRKHVARCGVLRSLDGVFFYLPRQGAGRNAVVFCWSARAAGSKECGRVRVMSPAQEAQRECACMDPFLFCLCRARPCRDSLPQTVAMRSSDAAVARFKRGRACQRKESNPAMRSPEAGDYHAQPAEVNERSERAGFRERPGFFERAPRPTARF